MSSPGLKLKMFKIIFDIFELRKWEVIGLNYSFEN